MFETAQAARSSVLVAHHLLFHKKHTHARGSEGDILKFGVMAEVVDLALSDDEQVHEVDLSVDLVSTTSAPAGLSSKRKSRGSGGGGVSGPGASAGDGAASVISPNKRNKRGKRHNNSIGTAAAEAPLAVVDVDESLESCSVGVGVGGGGVGGSSSSSSSSSSSRKKACAACENEVRNPFSLERCGHALCPTCVMSIATPSTACPAAACTGAISLRDLALILTEAKWLQLQEQRIEAFRAGAEKGCRCPTCEAWVEVGDSSGGGAGTARQRAERLLLGAPLVCHQGHCLCRFCGASLQKRAPSCGCGGAKLLAVSGLLSLLEELLATPASVTLCGPVGPLPKPRGAAAAAAARGRSGRGGGGRGRGGGGRGAIGGGNWAAIMSGFGGNGYAGTGAGSQKTSSKWSKGTGYGGSGDAAAAEKMTAIAAEAEGRADKAMVVVFDALTVCLPPRGDIPDHLPELVALVRESSLLQVVCQYLRNDSLMDIAKRRQLYQSLFKLVLAFALHELLAPLIDHVPPKGGRGAKSGLQADGSSNEAYGAGASGKGKGKGRGKGSPTAGAHAGCATAAAAAQDDDNEIVLVGVSGGDGGSGDGAGEEDGEGEEDDDVSVADLMANANHQAKIFAQAAGVGDGKGGEAGTLAFALQVMEVYDKVKASLTYLRGLAEARASSPAVVALTAAFGPEGVAGAGLGRKRKREAADIVEVSLESRYVSALGDSRFKLVPLLGPGQSHHFSAQASKQKDRTGGRARAARIHQEVSTLATSLPVQPDSSIFLRVDEDRFDVMRAMITGPKGTPYEGGCFEFDILLPPDYPNKPPQVHFLTTGNGRVRFNPNLYNTGKVCLSLLGTWTGPGWNAKTSTLLQVLISIQSLIFVAEPYFNEPGFEGQLGTPQGRAASLSYNRKIRNGTLMFGILEVLEGKRSGAMADVQQKHFRLMKGQILRTARAWLNDLGVQGVGGAGDPRFYNGGQNAGCAGNYTSMAKVVAKIEKLVSAL